MENDLGVVMGRLYVCSDGIVGTVYPLCKCLVRLLLSNYAAKEVHLESIISEKIHSAPIVHSFAGLLSEQTGQFSAETTKRASLLTNNEGTRII
jgi:hypothetical protein